MIYIHKLESVLSSIFLAGGSFSLLLRRRPNIMGSQATRSMAKNSHFTRAFTLIELLVVVAVIAILISIAYPVYTGILERGKVTQDMNNLRQIGLAIQTYLNDNDQILPATTTAWPGTSAAPVLYPKYISSRKIFQSPFDKRPSSEATDGTPPVSYGINANMYILTTATPPGVERNMARVVSPASTILMAARYNGNPASASSWPGTAGNAPSLPPGGTGGGIAETSGTHSNGTRLNALFCDLHTESLIFGPASVLGSFQDTASDPLGKKHWDPTQ
jgi:prepilin-type N-terminal cleavage/methylation domain-containing protein/prepilin-type processing-associated H-X9-DG protein